MKMRLLHLLHQYLPTHVGGVELNTHYLVQEQRVEGHDVALFYPDARGVDPMTGPRVDEEGVVHLAIPIRPPSAPRRFAATFRHAALHRALGDVLTDWQPDVVHVQHLLGLPASSLTLLQDRKIPYVVTLHDYWWVCANAQLLTNDTQQLCSGPHWWINCGRCALARAGLGEAMHHAAPLLSPAFAWRARQLSAGLERAAAITAPTAFTRDVYHELGLEGRIEIVPNGIPLPDPVPARTEPRVGVRVAYLGSIAPQKGVHLLVSAVNQLPHESVRLDIYGNLAVFPEYVAELRASCKHPGIQWHGPQTNEAAIHKLAQADVLVVPSIWYETSGLVIQEAFAVGVPVVAARLGAMAERVRHGEDGLLFRANDVDDLAATLRRLIDEPTLLPHLRSGIRPVRTIAEQARQLESVYERARAASA